MLSTSRIVNLEASHDGQASSKFIVPDGFPTGLSGPLIWEGKDFVSNPDQYVYHLDDEEIFALEKAIAYFKGSFFLCVHDQISH